MRLTLCVLCLYFCYVSGCRLFRDLQPLDENDLKKEQHLTVSDLSLPGEWVATFEVQGSTNVSFIVPDNSDYVTWKKGPSTLEIYLSDFFPRYELIEKLSTCQLGSVQIRCGLDTKLNLRLRLVLLDSNNHPPEFISPEDYVYMVNFPLVEGSKLSAVGLGPEIQAMDVDRNNIHITFSIFGSAANLFEAVYVKRIRDKWDVHVADILVKKNVTKPMFFNIVAQDTGVPRLLGSAPITLIPGNVIQSKVKPPDSRNKPKLSKSTVQKKTSQALPKSKISPKNRNLKKKKLK